MTGLVGPSRAIGGDAPKMLARAFARMAWPAFVVLVATGIWNVTAVHYSSQDSAWKAVLMAKIAVVIVAGVAVALHQRARTKAPARPVGFRRGRGQRGGAGHGHPAGRVTPNTPARRRGVWSPRTEMGLTWGPVHRHVDPGEGESHAC